MKFYKETKKINIKGTIIEAIVATIYKPLSSYHFLIQPCSINNVDTFRVKIADLQLKKGSC